MSGGALRSFENPRANGRPDHYSNRYTGTADNGGVRTNSTIVSHAYYLAIEGGTNRTSGLPVEGVGRAHRDQIEKAFSRAFKSGTRRWCDMTVCGNRSKARRFYAKAKTRARNG